MFWYVLAEHNTTKQKIILKKSLKYYEIQRIHLTRTSVEHNITIISSFWRQLE